MNRAVLTAVPVRVTSLTSTTPRRLTISTRRPARVAATSYVRVPSPESITISTRSPFMGRPPRIGPVFEYVPRRNVTKRTPVPPVAREDGPAGAPRPPPDRETVMRGATTARSGHKRAARLDGEPALVGREGRGDLVNPGQHAAAYARGFGEARVLDDRQRLGRTRAALAVPLDPLVLRPPPGGRSGHCHALR